MADRPLAEKTPLDHNLHSYMYMLAYFLLPNYTRATDQNRTGTICLEGRGTTIMQQSRILPLNNKIVRASWQNRTAITALQRLGITIMQKRHIGQTAGMGGWSRCLPSHPTQDSNLEPTL